MKIFFDTEFSNFDEPWLISLGAVTETGQEWYGEVEDYDVSLSSGFVMETVLPLLGRHPGGLIQPEKELSRSFASWLSSLGERAEMVCDYPLDWYILADFIRLGGDHENLLPPKGVLWSRMDSPLFRTSFAESDDFFWSQKENEGKRHHALYDARWLKRSFELQEKVLQEINNS